MIVERNADARGDGGRRARRHNKRASVRQGLRNRGVKGSPYEPAVDGKGKRTKIARLSADVVQPLQSLDDDFEKTV